MVVNTIDRLVEAQDFSFPLFGIKDRLEFEEFTKEDADYIESLVNPQPLETVIEEDSDDGGYVDYTVTHPSGLDELNCIHSDSRDFDVGIAVSRLLYKIANPSVHKCHDVLLREQIKKYGIIEGTFGPSTSREDDMSKAYGMVINIVNVCAGLAYNEHKGHQPPDLAKHEKTKPDDSNDPRFMEGGKYFGLTRAMTQLTIMASDEIYHTCTTALKLYKARGIQAVKDLVPMDFGRAREYISLHTGVDIMSPLNIVSPQGSKPS